MLALHHAVLPLPAIYREPHAAPAPSPVMPNALASAEQVLLVAVTIPARPADDPDEQEESIYIECHPDLTNTPALAQQGF